jgi:hypothetical protein
MKDYRKIPKTDQTRPAPPKNWRFTARDQAILRAIHEYEGFLAVEQIRRMFFGDTGSGRTAAYDRLSILWRARLLQRPDNREKALLPTMIYWLDKQGAEFVAEGDLKGFVWVNRPRFTRVAHDLLVNEFHLDLEEAAAAQKVRLVQWIPGYVFDSKPDQVAYQDERGRRQTAKVKPDAFFSVIHNRRELRFILEVDTASEQNWRVIDEKVRRVIPYIDSDDYERRFGHRSGRLLIVTQGKRRALLLKQKTEEAIGKLAQWVLITPIELITPERILTDTIWLKGGSNNTVSLLDG